MSNAPGDVWPDELGERGVFLVDSCRLLGPSLSCYMRLLLLISRFQNVADFSFQKLVEVVLSLLRPYIPFACSLQKYSVLNR